MWIQIIVYVHKDRGKEMEINDFEEMKECFQNIELDRIPHCHSLLTYTDPVVKNIMVMVGLQKYNIRTPHHQYRDDNCNFSTL